MSQNAQVSPMEGPLRVSRPLNAKPSQSDVQICFVHLFKVIVLHREGEQDTPRHHSKTQEHSLQDAMEKGDEQMSIQYGF